MVLRLARSSVEIGISTTDLAGMVEFYEHFLGLELERELDFPGGHQRRYVLGRNTLKLVEYDDPPAPPVPGGGPAMAGMRYLSLVVEDIEATAAELAASPYQVVQELTPFESMPGVHYLFVADPDGNWLELAGTIREDRRVEENSP